MAHIEIQGIMTHYRDRFDDEDVLWTDLPQDEQYFRRTSIPFTDEEIIAKANKEDDFHIAKEQQAWVDREKKRLDVGVYCTVNGKITFIPGSYYGYLNYWELEHGEKPDYREADRLFFLFMEFLYFETGVLGVTRGKGRRQGATSIGAYWLWWICGRKENCNGGIISYNDTAGGEVFKKMFTRGFKSLLPFFQEEHNATESFIRFIETDDKKKKGLLSIKRRGLNSYIDFRPTTLNSYDSGRLTFFLADETGKLERIDINTYWSKVAPTLKTGRHKVGFAYMPTTVNPKNRGGEHYQKFWKDADQNAIDLEIGLPRGLNTPHKVVRYFVPATEGYAGCIDKFGNSVVDDPENPIMGNDGHWITKGARSIILEERKLKEGEQLMEHRRDFPLDEYDMFAFSTGQCEFNEANLIRQIQYLEDHPSIAYWRQVRFFEEKDDKTGVVNINWADDAKGCWWLNEWPKEPNKFLKRGGIMEPENQLLYASGADTYRNIFAENGSDGAITIYKKSCIINGEETGLKPVAIYMGRPRLVKFFNKEALMGCMAYGCKINFEIDAGTWFYEDFAEWGAIRFLEWTPALDPTKKHPLIKPGTESANPFQLAKQLEVMKMYLDGHRQDVYTGNIHRVTHLPMLKQAIEYNHAERTPYHLIVSFMMALLPTLGVPQITNYGKPATILRTYKIKIPA